MNYFLLYTALLTVCIRQRNNNICDNYSLIALTVFAKPEVVLSIKTKLNFNIFSWIFATILDFTIIVINTTEKKTKKNFILQYKTEYSTVKLIKYNWKKFKTLKISIWHPKLTIGGLLFKSITFLRLSCALKFKLVSLSVEKSLSELTKDFRTRYCRIIVKRIVLYFTILINRELIVIVASVIFFGSIYLWSYNFSKKKRPK